jgi:DNA-binding transcriptional LysR family regulator
MGPRRLRLLLELSRLGSMRAVADALGCTTSTVSQQLAVLAREAAATLIEPIAWAGVAVARPGRPVELSSPPRFRGVR